MARPLGVLLFVGLALVSITWSVANTPEPTVTLAYAGDPGGTEADGGVGAATGALGPTEPGDDSSGSDLVDVLARSGFESRQDLLLPVGPGLEAGLYRVAGVQPTTTKHRKTTSSTPVPSTTKTKAGTKTGKTGSKATKGKKDDQSVLGRGGKPRQAPTPENVDLHVEGATGPATPVTDRGEIKPGLYATAYDASGCSYQLTRVMADRSIAVIGEDSLASGRMLVNINDIEPDWFTSSSGCGAWYAWSPLSVPLNRAANGDYWVGDLATGVWQVPFGCRWEKVVSFRGAMLHDVTAYGKAPQRLVVDDDTFGVRIRGCTSELTLDEKATEQWVADEALRAETGQRGGQDTKATATQAKAKAKAKPKSKRKTTTTTAVAPAETAPAPAPEPTPAPAPEPAPAPTNPAPSPT